MTSTSTSKAKKKKSVQPQNTLLLKVQSANILSSIVTEFKDTFQNLDLENIKDDYEYIKYLIQQVEAKFNDKDLFDPSNLSSIDKNDIVIQLVKAIYPQITDNELKVIENIVGFIVSNNMVKKAESSISSFLKNVISKKS